MNDVIANPASRLPPGISRRLRLPLIAAPMLHVSGPELVVAACRAGVIGSFPTLNPGLLGAEGGLDAWLSRILSDLGDPAAHAPVCPNIIMRNPDLDAHVASVIDAGIEMVITSVGSPKPIMGRLHDAGIFVLADVATIEHARKAIDTGVDGLILLTAGAGGQTGWLNPFAFVRGVRQFFDGPVVLAGGISDGAALRAAEALGCDLAYMGTKFIATRESLVPDDYRRNLVDASMDDIILTKAFTGLWGSFLRRSIVAEGLDPDNLDESISEELARGRYGARGTGPRRWTGLQSAGHSVSGVGQILSVEQLVRQTAGEYAAAASGFQKLAS